MRRQFNVRISEEDFTALKEISDREMRTVSQTVRLFIRRYLPVELDRARQSHPKVEEVNA